MVFFGEIFVELGETIEQFYDFQSFFICQVFHEIRIVVFSEKVDVYMFLSCIRFQWRKTTCDTLVFSVLDKQS